MDVLQARTTLKRLLDTKKVGRDNSCVLIDGNWGIGKTYLIETNLKQDENYEIIYVSAFGKNTVKEIENALLIKLIPGFNKVNNFSSFSKLLGTFAKGFFNRFTGVNIENYLNAFSIEDISIKSNSKKQIVCIDDLERKSDLINMKDLLGLFERTSVNFDVIVIANTKEFNEDDFEIFDRHREKVINHYIEINKLNKNVLKEILGKVDEFKNDEIINIYFENVLAFGTSGTVKNYMADNIYNLRMFIRYVELILRARAHIGEKKIDAELIRMSKAVVYDYYSDTKDKKSKQVNFDRFNIYNDLKRLLLFEDISINAFKLYKSQVSEIRQDINILYNLYKLNDEELTNFINKIDNKIREEKKDYFIDQSSTISLASALDENKMLIDKRFNSLLNICVEIYVPEENIPFVPLKSKSRNEKDMFGNEIECSEDIHQFIEALNKICIDKYDVYISDKIKYAMRTNDYDGLLKLYKYDEINSESQFEKIFDHYLTKLEDQYTLSNSEKIETLIQVTNSKLVQNFFDKRIKNDRSVTRNKKYQYYKNVLEEKMYHKDRLEFQLSYLED